MRAFHNGIDLTTPLVVIDHWNDSMANQFFLEVYTRTSKTANSMRALKRTMTANARDE